MTIRYKVDGKQSTLRELSEKHRIPYHTLRYRIWAGYSIEQALAIGRLHASSAVRGHRSSLKSLSLEVENQLLKDREEGMTYLALAKKYEVSRATVFRAVKAHKTKQEQLCLNF